MAVLLVLGAGELAGCRDQPKAARPAEPPARVARTLAGPAAFDLVVLDGGAALLWAKPLVQGGGVMLERLGARG